MPKNSGKQNNNDAVDSLFQLSLAEFINARNALAAQLKKAGRASDAALIKTLAKPSVSAWAVNQLYWNHRRPFDELMAVGQRLRKLQTSGIGGKVTEMRAALDARRDALTQLSELATELLQDSGHSPSQDTIRRVTTTLEAMSSFASPDDGPTPGRLSTDVDPPGFESLTAFGVGSLAPRAEKKADAAPSKTHLRLVEKQREVEETRHANTAAARVAVQSAKKALAEARSSVQLLETAQKQAYAESKRAEKERREAEERLKKLSAIADEATERAHNIAAEFKEANESLDAAKRNLDKATRELESLLRA